VKRFAFIAPRLCEVDALFNHPSQECRVLSVPRCGVTVVSVRAASRVLDALTAKRFDLMQPQRDRT